MPKAVVCLEQKDCLGRHDADCFLCAGWQHIWSSFLAEDKLEFISVQCGVFQCQILYLICQLRGIVLTGEYKWSFQWRCCDRILLSTVAVISYTLCTEGCFWNTSGAGRKQFTCIVYVSKICVYNWGIIYRHTTGCLALAGRNVVCGLQRRFCNLKERLSLLRWHSKKIRKLLKLLHPVSMLEHFFLNSQLYFLHISSAISDFVFLSDDPFFGESSWPFGKA